MLSEDIQRHLLAFVIEELSGAEFESWLYASGELEESLSPDDYLALLAADFRTPEGVREAQATSERLLETFDPWCVARARVILTLRGMLNGSVNLLVGLRELAHMHYAGYAFIPVEFAGYESETDTVPEPSQYGSWEPHALEHALQPLYLYREGILQATGELLRTLEGQRGAT
jgi:hypothetical protein